MKNLAIALLTTINIAHAGGGGGASYSLAYTCTGNFTSGPRTHELVEVLIDQNKNYFFGSRGSVKLNETQYSGSSDVLKLDSYQQNSFDFSSKPDFILDTGKAFYLSLDTKKTPSTAFFYTSEKALNGIIERSYGTLICEGSFN
jgi:hypothetical protein